MSKKQTAVEWQFEQLFNSFEKFNNGECTFTEFLKRNLEIREQAKQMEKQQIIDAMIVQNGELYLNSLGDKTINFYKEKNEYLFKVKQEIEKL